MITADALVDRIMVVMEEAFDPAYGEAWNRRQIADALMMPSTHAITVDADALTESEGAGDPVGFVLSRAAPGEEELLLIAVKPRARGNGLAKRLIERLFDAARLRGSERIFLEMRRGNPAETLYRKMGFEPIGMRPNYYRMTDGSRIDAITFGCSI